MLRRRYVTYIDDDLERVKAYKTLWLRKRKNGKKSPKEMVIGCKPKTNITLMSWTSDYGIMFTDVSSSNLLNLVTSNINAGICECITEYPYKIYFDIDNKDVIMDAQELIKIIIKAINDIFSNSDMGISGSITSKKISYHIVLNNYMIRNDDEKIKFKSIVQYLHDNISISFDTSVYGRYQCIKCINQSKPKSQDIKYRDDIRTRRIQRIILNDNPKKHIITAFFNDNYKTIDDIKFKSYEINHNIRLTGAYKKLDISALPQLDMLNKDKYIDINNITAIELLNLCPIDTTFNHTYTHRIARFCYTYNLTFEQFYLWYQHKNNSINTYNKWLKHWDRLKEFPRYDKKYLLSILSNYYPSIRQQILNYTLSNQFNLNLNNNYNKQIIKHLNHEEHITDVNKYTILNLGMCSGKTTQVINYLKKQDRFLCITSNQSLGYSIFQRELDAEIEDIKHYKISYTSKNRRNITNADKLVVCINSLLRIADNIYDVIVIDEIETLLKSWHDNKTLTNKGELWNIFINMLRNARKIIMMDAFITNITINFINNININNDKIDLIQKEKEISNRKLIIMKKYSTWIYEIITNLRAGKKIFIFYPFKDGKNKSIKSMKKIKKILVNATNKTGKIYNSMINGKKNDELRDVNNAWANIDFVITNSKITVGINYDVVGEKAFDMVYIAIAGFCSPRDIIQVSYRCRELKDNLIKCVFLSKYMYKRSFINDITDVKCELYKKLIKDIIIEKQAKISPSLILFSHKAGYKLEHDNEESKAIKKIIKPLLNCCDTTINYENIDNITHQHMIIIKDKITDGRATTHEIYQLNKYFYRLKFKLNTPESIMIKYWNNHDIIDNIIKLNTKDKYKTTYNKINDLLKSIQHHNDFMFIVPSIDEFNDIKLMDEHIKNIFEYFDFSYIKKENTNYKMILRDIYNSVFNYNIIKSTHDKSRNNKFIIKETTYEMFTDLFNYLHIFHTDVPTIQPEVIEDVFNDEINKTLKITYKTLKIEPQNKIKINKKSKNLIDINDIISSSKNIVSAKVIDV